MRRLVFFVAVIMVMTVGYVSETKCEPVQWSAQDEGNGHYYDMVIDYGHHKNWTTSRDQAAASEHLGIAGHLVTVTSELEQRFLFDNFLSLLPQEHTARYFWIGATDIEHEGDWQWITGEEWDSEFWGLIEPSNSWGGEHYAMIWYRHVEGWVWNDMRDITAPGSYDYGYFVEFDLPIPGDTNHDFMVNDLDAAILATYWQYEGMIEIGWEHGDFNGDGKVTDADAAILATHWQEGVEGSAPIPEPSAILLLAGGLLLLLLWRRKRVTVDLTCGIRPTAARTSTLREMHKTTNPTQASVLPLLVAASLTTLHGFALGQALPAKNSSEFTYKYEFDVDPSDPTLPLAIDLDGNGKPDFDGSAMVAEGIAHFDDQSGYWSDDPDHSPPGTGIWRNSGITTASGYTLEFKLKVGPMGTGGQYPVLGTGVVVASPIGPGNQAWLIFKPDGQKWGQDTATLFGYGTGTMIDLGSNINNDDFHVFRIAREPSREDYWVWRDGVLLNSGGAPLGPAVNSPDHSGRMGFGRGGVRTRGESEFEYFRFVAGAFGPGPEPIPGDCDRDGKVNDMDAAILATFWQYEGPLELGWEHGDFNGDEKVTDADAAMLATHWQEGVGEQAASVPEPSAILLLAGGLLLLLPWWRKRATVDLTCGM